MKLLAWVCLAVCAASGQDIPANKSRIGPEELVYQGAFRLPEHTGYSLVESWDYGGQAMAFYADGDPKGSQDRFTGSIFAVGHAWAHLVSEISIPVPVISLSKDPSSLHMASQLQPFTDILNVMDLEIPRTGLAYLPKQGAQAQGKLYFCWGYHMQEGTADLTHGWCETNLSEPNVQRGWYRGGLETHVRNMSTNDYLCEIPGMWADPHAPGLLLATGRFRDGGWSGQGPSLFAVGPWNQGNPPVPGSELANVPLIVYASTYEETEPNHTLSGYHHSDEWSGVAWITSGDRSAVLFVGTKGKGSCWYGNPQGPCLSCENRGWWSDTFSGQMLFYDAGELAEVAVGSRQPWEPQPYAVLEIDEYLFHVTNRQQKHHLGAACFDAESGHLYVFEPNAEKDKPIIHVWRLDPGIEPANPVRLKKGSSARR